MPVKSPKLAIQLRIQVYSEAILTLAKKGRNHSIPVTSKVINKEEMAGSDAPERSVHGKGTSPPYPTPPQITSQPCCLGLGLPGTEAWIGWGQRSILFRRNTDVKNYKAFKLLCVPQSL